MRECWVGTERRTNPSGMGSSRGAAAGAPLASAAAPAAAVPATAAAPAPLGMSAGASGGWWPGRGEPATDGHASWAAPSAVAPAAGAGGWPLAGRQIRMGSKGRRWAMSCKRRERHTGVSRWHRRVPTLPTPAMPSRLQRLGSHTKCARPPLPCSRQRHTDTPPPLLLPTTHQPPHRLPVGCHFEPVPGSHLLQAPGWE